MAAYAAVGDMLLGDLEISSTVDKSVYLERASRDIDLWLSVLYTTPFVLTDPVGLTILKNATADLASAYLILAVAQAGEDNRINAYGKHLYDRATDLIKVYLDGTRAIPGAIPKNGAETTTSGPVAIYQHDKISGVDAFYDFVQNPQYIIPQRYRVWPGAEQQGLDPN